MSKTFSNEVADAIVEVCALTEALAAAEMVTSRASKDEINIRNKLNAAQRQLDTLLDSLKKMAPIGSDWKRPAERSL